MENFMNEPVDQECTEEDIIREYNKCQDKKKLAKMYCTSVGEITEILKRSKD